MPTWGHGAQLRPTALTTACVFHTQYLAVPCTHPVSSYCLPLLLLFPGLECPSSPLHSRLEVPPTPPLLTQEALCQEQAALCWLLCPCCCVAWDSSCSSLGLIFLISKMKHRTKLSSPHCGVVRAKLLTWCWVEREPPPPWPSLPQLCT